MDELEQAHGELDQALSGAPITPPTFTGAAGKRCRVHVWLRDGDVVRCERCPAVRDEARARRGKSSRRLGADQERRIERVYGPRKVGEFGDAVDHIGALWKWQSKATRAAPPVWLSVIANPVQLAKLPAFVSSAMTHMDGLRGDLAPVVIRSFVRQGTPTRDWLFVRAEHFASITGQARLTGEFVVIPGVWWLDHFGRDEPKA